MRDADKNWIDKASYETLLRHWRFAPAGDPMFIGDTGEYYKKVLHEKKIADPSGAVAASKSIGWD